MTPTANRLEVAIDRWGGIPPVVVSELRSAVDLMYDGQSCAAVSALLAARAELVASPH
ncbi:MAG: hypothetical protein ACRDSR_05270 [Pseudonocardiaceae bacterium]